MIGGRNLRSSVMTSFGSGTSSHLQPVSSSSSTNRNSQQKYISNNSRQITSTTSPQIGSQQGSKKSNIIEVTTGQFQKDKNVIKIQEKSIQTQQNKGIGKTSYTANHPHTIVFGSPQQSIRQQSPVMNNNQDAAFTSIPQYFNSQKKQNYLNSNNLTGTIVPNYLTHGQQQHKLFKSPYQQDKSAKLSNSTKNYQIDTSNLGIATTAASNNSSNTNVNSNGGYQQVQLGNFNLKDAAGIQISNQILVNKDSNTSNNNRQSIHKSNIQFEQRQTGIQIVDNITKNHGKKIIDPTGTISSQTKFIDFQQQKTIPEISNIYTYPQHNLAPQKQQQQQQQQKQQGQISPLLDQSIFSPSHLSHSHLQQTKETINISQNNSQYHPSPPVFYPKNTPTTDSIPQDLYPLPGNKESLLNVSHNPQIIPFQSEYYSPYLIGEIKNQSNSNKSQTEQFTQDKLQNNLQNQQNHQLLNQGAILVNNTSNEQLQNPPKLATYPYPSQPSQQFPKDESSHELINTNAQPTFPEETVKRAKLNNFSERVQSATKQFKNVLQDFNETSNKNMNEYHTNIQFLETTETQLKESINEVTRNLKAQLLEEFNKSLSICKTGQFEVQQILGYLGSTENDLTSNLESIVRDMDISSLDDIINQYEQVIIQYQTMLKDKLSKYTYSSYSTIDHQAKGISIQSLSKQLQSQLVELLRMQPYTAYILNLNQNTQQENPKKDSKNTNEISSNLLRRTGEFINSNIIEYDYQLPYQTQQQKSVFVSFENKDCFTNTAGNSSLKEPSNGQQQQQQLENNNIIQNKNLSEQNTNNQIPQYLLSPSFQTPFLLPQAQFPLTNYKTAQEQSKQIDNLHLFPSDHNHSQQFSGGSNFGNNPSTAANTLTEASCSIAQTQFTNGKGQNDKIKGIIDLYENLGDVAKAKRRMLSNQEITSGNVPCSINLWNSAEQPKSMTQDIDLKGLIRAPQIRDFNDNKHYDQSGVTLPIPQIPSFEHENQQSPNPNNCMNNSSKVKHKYSELLQKIQVNQSITEKLYSEVFLGQSQQQQQHQQTAATFKFSLLEDDIPLGPSGQCYSIVGSKTNGSCKN